MLNMKPIAEIPDMQKRGYHDLAGVLKRFIDSDNNIVEIEFNEKDYKNAKSCSGSLSLAIKRTGYACKVVMRNNRVFLMRIR